jgi:ketosteroid isomerase-like protein
MTEYSSTSLHALVLHTFTTVEAKDLETMIRLFADEAVVFDPHFPTPQMQGKVAILHSDHAGARSIGQGAGSAASASGALICAKLTPRSLTSA